MLRHVSLGVLVCLLSFATVGLADPVDDYVSKMLSKTGVPGISIAVVRNGEVIKARGFGRADIELDVPATEKTVYQWASVTKQFTATAIMLLVQDGKLKLTDPVSLHYPAAPKTWKDVTIRHLLDHTSGIRSVTELPDFRRNLRKDYEREELIAQVNDLELDFAPGEKWHYNNTGYLLLGCIIERASGQSYQDFLKARIFDPSGMTTARLNDQSDLIPNRATGYDVISNQVKRAVFVSPTQPFAAGALVGTVLDLAKWDAALYGEKLLPSAVRDSMWQPVRLSDGKTRPYGFGWQLGSIRGHRYVAHGGGINGFSTFILRLVDDRLTVIVLMNGNGPSPQTVSERIAACYLPDLSLASIKPATDPQPELTARLKQALSDLVEKRDSEIVTDAFRRGFRGSRRRHGMIQEDLKSVKEFTYLASEKPEPELAENPDSPSRVVSYKLVTASGARFYSFGLTAENKLAGINIEEE